MENPQNCVTLFVDGYALEIKSMRYTLTYRPREGVIIKWPLNGLFNDASDVILTSQTDVRKMVDHDPNPNLSTF